MGGTDPKEITVHTFCHVEATDADDRAYGVVAYFRYIDKKGKMNTSLIIAK